MSKFIDITGNRYGNLIVIKRVDNQGKGFTVYECLCDCGNTKLVRANNLKSGAVKSCGCLRRNNTKNRTHNMSHTKLYRVWANMKNRCYNQNLKSYKDYGGRGITVCDEWRDSFENFMNWAYSSGYTEHLTLDRIDNNGGYNPSNCRWTDPKKQANNRRSCVIYTHDGRSMNLREWCDYLNLNYKLVYNRIHKCGWDFEKAITEPCDITKRNKRKARK